MRTGLRALMIFAVLIAMYYGYNSISGKKNIGTIKQISIEVNTEGKEIKVNGKKLETKMVPFLSGDSIMMPLKEIIVGLGGSCEFDKASGAFTVDYNLVKINSYINNNYVFVGNTKKKMKTVPILKDESVFVSEQFFIDVYGFTGEKNKSSITLTKDFIVFGDTNIETFVRETLKKPTGYFTKDELRSIYTIKLDGKGIKSLEGLEYFTNAKILDLKNNKIKDIAQLKSLTNLVEVNLSNNLISDIRPLTSCKRINVMNVSQNLITGTEGLRLVIPLKRLDISKNRLGRADLDLPDGLEVLDVSNNDFASTASIKVLPKLKTLILNNNPILGVASLNDFTELKSVSLWGYTSVKDIKKEADLIKLKATEIMKKLNLDKKTSFEKTCIIYDSVLYNTDYKRLAKTDANYRENSRPSSIFTRGGGDSSALSQLVHILLRMNGIECYTYDGNMEFAGNKEFHTWNLISVGKQYYYSDISMGHMLGKDDYGHTFMNVSGRQFLATHPQGVLQQFSTIEDSTFANRNFPKGWALYNEVALDYFSGGITMSGPENKLSLLTKDKSKYVVSDEKYVYYRNDDDGGKLYRLNIDGSNKIKLNDDEPIYIYSDLKYLYYINGAADANGQKGTICTYTKKDGKKEVISKNTDATWITLKGSYIYHKSISKAGQQPGLYYMDKDGSGQEALVNDVLSLNKDPETNFEKYYRQDIFIIGEILFYTNNSDNDNIYSVRSNGKNRKKLASESGKILEVIDDYIYYKNSSGYFRIKLDGTEKSTLKTGIY